MGYKDYLERGLKTAFGCTEPITIAYTAAEAKEVLGHEPDRIQADLSANIIKNTHNVYVPGAQGCKGVDISLTAGALLSQSAHKLEALAHIDKTRLEGCDRFIQQGRIQVQLKEDMANLYIQVTAYYQDSYARILAMDGHTSIARIEKDGEVFHQKNQSIQGEIQADFSFDKIYGYAQTADSRDLQGLLDREISCSYAITREGIQNPWGSDIGRLILERHPRDPREKVVAYTTAGSDARMSGAENPVVTNSGSGNRGISVSVPLVVYTREKNLDREDLQRGLLFANFLGLYRKKNIGKLSAYCGVVSAASSATYGLTLLKGEDRQVIKETLASALAINGDILYDGAKTSCAMKIASSLRNAFLAYNQAKAGRSFKVQDGIVKDGIGQALEIVGNIVRYGVRKTDEVILSEVLGNQDYLKEFE